jgi:hypothetical protein
MNETRLGRGTTKLSMSVSRRATTAPASRGAARAEPIECASIGTDLFTIRLLLVHTGALRLSPLAGAPNTLRV